MCRIEHYSTAMPDQQDQYIALYIDTWQRNPYRELFTRDEVLASVEINRQFLYLLVDGGAVLGFVGGRPLSQCDFFDYACVPPVDSEKGFYIDELGVDFAHRKSGFGQKLTEYLIEVARLKEFNQFVLRTHQSPENPAARFYERLGFETRLNMDGQVHGIDTQHRRVDTATPEVDFRVYYYKTCRP